MGSIKRHIRGIAVAIVAVGVSLVVVDWLLHLTNYSSLIVKRVYPRHYFVKDAEIGFDIAPNTPKQAHTFFDLSYDVWSNSLGCFDTEYASETPYIYLTGDSFTWGFTPFADKWGALVQSRLGERVVKCGVGGFGTKQELVKTTRDMARLPSPRLIIVGYTQGNDIHDDAHFPNGSVYNGYAVKNLAKDGVTEVEAEAKYALYDRFCTIEEPASRFLQGIKYWLKDHSVVYNLLKNNARSVVTAVLPNSLLKKASVIVEEKKAATSTDAEVEAKYQEHLRNILGFKALAVKEGAKLLFVLVPGENERLKPFLAQNGIAYLDLKPVFEEYGATQALRWRVDGHWNVAGNHLAGYVVSRYIIENGLVPVPDKAAALAGIDADMTAEFGPPKRNDLPEENIYGLD